MVKAVSAFSSERSLVAALHNVRGGLSSKQATVQNVIEASKPFFFTKWLLERRLNSAFRIAQVTRFEKAGPISDEIVSLAKEKILHTAKYLHMSDYETQQYVIRKQQPTLGTLENLKERVDEAKGENKLRVIETEKGLIYQELPNINFAQEDERLGRVEFARKHLPDLTQGKGYFAIWNMMRKLENECGAHGSSFEKMKQAVLYYRHSQVMENPQARRPADSVGG